MPSKKKTTFTKVTIQSVTSILGPQQVQPALTCWEKRAAEGGQSSSALVVDRDHEQDMGSEVPSSAQQWTRRKSEQGSSEKPGAKSAQHEEQSKLIEKQQGEIRELQDMGSEVPSSAQRWTRRKSEQGSSEKPGANSAQHEQQSKLIEKQQGEIQELQEENAQLHMQLRQLHDIERHHAEQLQSKDRKHAQELAKANAGRKDTKEQLEQMRQEKLKSDDLLQALSKELQHDRHLSCQLERERSRIQDLQEEVKRLNDIASDPYRLKGQQVQRFKEFITREKEMRASQVQLQVDIEASQAKLAEAERQTEAAQARLVAIQSEEKSKKEALQALRSQMTSIELKLGKAADLLTEESIQYLLPGETCSYCLEGDGCLAFTCDDCSQRTCVKCVSAATLTNLGPTFPIDKRKRAAALQCLNGKCKGCLPQPMIRLLPDNAMKALEETRMELAIMEHEALKEKTSIVQLESLSQKTSLKKLLHLEEEIVRNMLTLRCPDCKAPFESFDACCALTCSKCSCCFCAWCLKASPNDKENHAHVATCSHNPLPGELFADEGLWKQCTNSFINKRVTEYIDSLSSKVASPLRDRCQAWMP